MKKIANIFVSLALAFFGLGLISCADAIVDDGSNVRSYVNSAGSENSSGAGNWMLCKNANYDIFDIQVWGDGAGTFKFINKTDCGYFEINSVGGGWIGGGLVPSDSGKTFDFSNVSKMTFEIRGSISPKALAVAVQGKKDGKEIMTPAKASIEKSASITSLSETEWTPVTFDVSEMASASVINAFCIIGAADWGSNIAEGQWFEVRNLDWTDASDKSVTIGLK